MKKAKFEKLFNDNKTRLLWAVAISLCLIVGLSFQPDVVSFTTQTSREFTIFIKKSWDF